MLFDREMIGGFVRKGDYPTFHSMLVHGQGIMPSFDYATYIPD